VVHDFRGVAHAPLHHPFQVARAVRSLARPFGLELQVSYEPMLVAMDEGGEAVVQLYLIRHEPSVALPFSRRQQSLRGFCHREIYGGHCAGCPDSEVVCVVLDSASDSVADVEAPRLRLSGRDASEGQEEATLTLTEAALRGDNTICVLQNRDYVIGRWIELDHVWNYGFPRWILGRLRVDLLDFARQP
jgi:hypothetical protein